MSTFPFVLASALVVLLVQDADRDTDRRADQDE